MSDNKNIYGFPQTTTTLIDSLRVGGKEDWTEFWKKYEGPIKKALQSMIWSKQRGGQRQLDYDNVEAYILVVFQRIQKRFSDYVHHGNSQFRGCILTCIADAIGDEVRRNKKFGWKNTSLTLDNDVENDEGKTVQFSETLKSSESRRTWSKDPVVKSTTVKEDIAYEERSIQLELCRAIIKESKIQAANRFPWRGNRKEIVNLLAHTDLSVGEIAKRCNTTSQNVSKAEAALKEKAEFYLNGYKSDDCGFWDELYGRFRLSGLDMDEAEKIIAAQIDSMSNK